MEHRFNQNLFGQQAPRVRGTLLMFLAFVYLFVGLAHSTAHVNEATANLNKVISTTISLEASLAATDGFDDLDSEKLFADAGYCQVYAPVLMPVLARVDTPAAQVISLLFAIPTFMVEDHPRLDTPPPKHLT
jgi:hypothetical protein